jgi:hypothetical protein
VKVIGNIGGNKTFDVVYNVGARFNSASVTNLLNTIRKNIALMTRAITVPVNTTGKLLGTDTMIYKVNGGLFDNADTLFSTTNADTLRSIIIIGGDLVIDGDIAGGKSSRAIIVMKNEAGQ